MRPWHAAVLGLLAALMATHWTTGWAMVGLAFLARWAWNLGHPRARRHRISSVIVDELHRPIPNGADLMLRGFTRIEYFTTTTRDPLRVRTLRGRLSRAQRLRFRRAWSRAWHRNP